MILLKILCRILRACGEVCRLKESHFLPIDSHKWETKIESYKNLKTRHHPIV